MANKKNNKIVIVRSNGELNEVDSYKNIQVIWRGDNNYIEINEPIKINKRILIDIGSNGICKIGKNCTFDNVYINLNSSNCKFEAGENNIIQECQFWICNEKDLEVIIGNDCIFSRRIVFRACDGHTIFDLKDPTNIINKTAFGIHIGNHVLFGQNTTILKDVTIPDDCVIGAGSLVLNNTFYSHSIIAGNPAKTIRNNISWAKEHIFEYKKKINTDGSILMNSINGKSIKINDSQYYILTANNDNNDCISLYNAETNKFLRHYNSKIIESPITYDDKLFELDSSFYAYIKEDCVKLFCSNPTLRKHAICEENGNLIISTKYTPSIFKICHEESAVNKAFSNIKTLSLEMARKYNQLKDYVEMEISGLKLSHVSARIPKKEIIIFIGTGKLGENSIYAYKKVYEIIARKKLPVTAVFFARNKIETEYFNKQNLPCEIWNYRNPRHIDMALQAKVSVFSTHTFANNTSNCILSACLSGSYKVQLWHGLFVKTGGCATLTEKSNTFRKAIFFEDCCVDVVTSPLKNNDVDLHYQNCFPGAQIICTGDARTDVLFQKNPHDQVDRWVKNNKNKIKVLISPTYRETKAESIEFINSLLPIITKMQKYNFACAVKFHPVFFSRLDELRTNIISDVEATGALAISERDDACYIMNKFDAMMSDYSSIRFDFFITKKPIILFRPDLLSYQKYRTINPINFFNELDSISYTYNSDTNIETLYREIKEDPLHDKRVFLIEKYCIHTDGENSNRVANMLLDIVAK